MDKRNKFISREEVNRLITKEEFLKKYNFKEELLQSAGISWNDLCDIYSDFSENKVKKYETILEQFIKDYLKDIDKISEKSVSLHSYRARVKKPEHLIEKIIRKRQENSYKYRLLDKNNYEKFITDLIGIRCLVIFKEDWESIHQYILSKFENNVAYYVNDSILDFDDDEEHFYIAEKPKVHIRNGDSREVYEKYLSPDCIIDGKIYRSAHYIIKYKGVYLEIQVRTLFEEGWGEIDHEIVYPYYKEDRIFKEYTELLNRLSGLADEMSGFFKRLKNLEVEHLKYQKESSCDIQQTLIEDEQYVIPNLKDTNITNINKANNSIPVDTIRGCIQAVFDE